MSQVYLDTWSNCTLYIVCAELIIHVHSVNSVIAQILNKTAIHTRIATIRL